MCNVQKEAMIPLERNQAMKHTKAEGCAKKGEIKNFTCIVLHQMKNSLPKIQFAINTQLKINITSKQAHPLRRTSARTTHKLQVCEVDST